MRRRWFSAPLMGGTSILVGLAIGLSVPAMATNVPKRAIVHRHLAGGFPHMSHVFVIMMENTSYNDLLNPSNANTTYIQSIANTYGLATDYSGVTHTSLPNYVAVSSGSTWGSNADDESQADQGYFNHLSLFDQLSQAGLSWRGYMESMPSAGYTGNSTTDGLYVRKHNPFMQYPDIFNNPAVADNVVPLTQLTHDLNTGKVADFNWITPNICNDMHGGAPSCPYPDTPTDANQMALYQDGNNFLQTWVTAIMGSKAWTGNSAIFITWDEGGYGDDPPYGPLDNTGCCDSPNLPATPANPTTGGGGDLVGGTQYAGGHVPMIVIGRNAEPGLTDSAPLNHYSLLQTIEQNWNLPFLGNASDTLQVQSLAPLLAHH